MSDAFARSRFMDAVHAFQPLEAQLRERTRSVAPKQIDAVLIDIDAALPGLDGEDLGRALVFKAHVTHWRYLSELGKKNIFQVIEEDTDPRLVAALADAQKGAPLMQTPHDREWAASVIQQLQEYRR